jgi:hypothetical protein
MLSLGLVPSAEVVQRAQQPLPLLPTPVLPPQLVALLQEPTFLSAQMLTPFITNNRNSIQMQSSCPEFLFD